MEVGVDGGSLLPRAYEQVALIVPTLNAGRGWDVWLAALKSQNIQPREVWVFDSESEDGTVEKARQHGLNVYLVERSTFDHGATRQRGVEAAAGADILVFLTQDALLSNCCSLEVMLQSFANPKVGAAYGRQLPHEGAKPIEEHARLFNYPPESCIKQFADAKMLGIKTAFISNSFAAYRREALMAVGGFPSGTIFGEDTIVAARMLLQGWKIAYCADAQVYHSHHYTYRQEFRRYFDIGVLHAREPWIQENFGGASGEGRRFVVSELKYLLRQAPWLIPSALLRTVLKLMGYRLGKLEARLPVGLKKQLSMHRRFWEREGKGAGDGL